MNNKRRIRYFSWMSFLLAVSCFQCHLSWASPDDEQALDLYLKGVIDYRLGRYKEAQNNFDQALGMYHQNSKSDVVLAGQSAADSEQTYQSQREESEYVIGSDDVLGVTVWQNPDLTQDVIVRPDGRISFPLIGDVRAAGLTIPQLSEVMTTRLKEYIRRVQVSISIKKIGGSKVIIIGEVARPGVYSISGRKTILEAIAQAGGFTMHAVVNSIVLVRGGLEHPYAERVNVNKALRADAKNNVVLESEDVVFVPKKFVSNVQHVLTQILDPISKGMYTAKEAQTWGQTSP